MDNADGKQARKTKNSTALGLLMDHGADCINTGLSTMAFIQIVNAETLWCYWGFLLLFQIFFFATIEEYFFGSLDFPMINAVNEGTTGTFCFLLVGVFLGNGVYLNEIVFGLKLYQVVFSGLFLVVSIQNLYALIKLFINFKFLDVLWKNFLFTYASVAYILVFNLSSNSVVWSQPKIVMYIFTIIFSRIIISIMICHIFHSNFDQMQVFPLITSTIMIGLVLFEKFLIDGKLNIPLKNRIK